MSLFTTILLAAAIATNAPPVRTTAELHALPNAAFAKGVTFDLTGTVAFVMGNMSFILVDETGGTRVWNRCKFPVRPGNTIRAAGKATHNRHGAMTLYATNAIPIGRTAPPEVIEAAPEQIARGVCDWRLVRTRGIVRDAYKDEIDPSWSYLVLNCDSHIIHAAVGDDNISDADLMALIDAEVSLEGICSPSTPGSRRFFGRHIVTYGRTNITVTRHAPTDPFDVPLIGRISPAQPESILLMKRHRAIGSVIAVWQRNRFLLETGDGHLMRVEVANGVKPPSFGDGVEVVGVPETDLYRINLSRAIFRPAKATLRQQAPQSVELEDLLKTPDGRTRINTDYYGRTIRIRGLVRNVTPQKNGGTIDVKCGTDLVPVDANACPECLLNVAVGDELEITGVCIFDTENWRPQVTLPRIERFLLVLRTPSDLKILSSPSWWTPSRLFVIICALLAALGGIAVWNRMLNRIVERRTRELMKERLAHDGADLKVEERTRLAVELHDTLAQNLTGISLQIDAAQMAAEENPNSVMPYLETARRKMQNCRENLRNCLWDLRSRAFEEKTLAEAIRKTIAPHVGTADVHVEMDVPCRKLSDNAIHAVLCIVRELVINAIRHGKATRISISGKLEIDGLAFTVSDNGVGFDPATRPGLSEGHFGLQGVSERARRLGGTFEIASKPNHGATAILSHLSPES